METSRNTILYKGMRSAQKEPYGAEKSMSKVSKFLLSCAAELNVQH